MEGQLKRFGVSLNSNLLKKFDSLIKKRGYASRSEAIRDLIREKLIEEEWKNADSETVGVFSYIYDHHKPDLTAEINSIQHGHLELIRSSSHFHIDHNNCLEVVILDGRSGDIKRITDKLMSLKGIKHGRLIMTSRGDSID